MPLTQIKSVFDSFDLTKRDGISLVTNALAGSLGIFQPVWPMIQQSSILRMTTQRKVHIPNLG